MKELTSHEIELVDGAGATEAGVGVAGAAGIGAATFGAGWGTVGVAAAVASSPIAVAAMVGLAFYAGYQLMMK